MEMPELPPLHDDEYEELKDSKLGVFIKLVHYMLGFQLDIKKKYELWSLVGPELELTSFWEICEGWSRDDRKRLAYLAIFSGYIEGRRYSTPTRVSLARLVMELERFENYPWGRVAFKVWVYTALPELDATYGSQRTHILEEFPDDLIISLHIFYLLQTRVINFVHKDIGEMFPKWKFDVEDMPAENIIKLMFVKKPWKWTMDYWEVTGTWVNIKPAVEDSPRPRKKARKEAPAEASEEAAAEASEEAAPEAKDIKTMFKDIVDAMREGFGTCLKEIKYLSERVEAVEKKVGITTKRKGTSSQNTTSPPKPTLEPGID
ncbi:BnaCnng58760D [Brassica napus]|uniref:BnaCnng58760D protein n=1 Tax=Brassica napus TaxID=3708 RepID=A0A078JSJ3_BRANA|nr:BnaCnng58760D [Brassica napus]